MIRQFKIDKWILVLIAIKLGVAALMLRPQEVDFPSISIGTPVYAQEKTTASKAPQKETASSVKVSSEQINLKILKSFEQKEQELNIRESALKKREEQLKLLQGEIEKKLGDIKKFQNKIEQLVTLRKDLIEKSIKHLVKVYSSMRPEEAGPLLEKLDKDITIQILSKMKGKAAGKILARVNPTLAAQLSEAIAKRK